jgi:mannose-6-phosphate isomerase-like protein (cupin superfamily)
MAERRWTKANLGEVEGVEHPQAGLSYLFGESRPRELYSDLGINIRVLQPGQPASLYHAESNDEFFIVLGGECLAIVEDEEVPLRKWDYLYAPPGTAHLIVGAGDGPATVLMVGGRRSTEPPRFPVSELAARYGASAAAGAEGAQEAYRGAGWEMTLKPAPFPWPPE